MVPSSAALMMAAMTLSCQKHLFSLPEGLHYLNCAYMAPLSKAVEAAGLAGLIRKRDPTAITPEDFFRESELSRERFAQLVNGDRERVAIIPAVSYGVATVVRNLMVEKGQNIVLLEEQFPSNVYGWQRCRERGAIIRTVAPPPGADRSSGWNQRILEAIDADTAVVALPHVHRTDGTRFDLVAVGRRAREVGAALVVDGTQSVGALPFDVREVRPDALLVAGYKSLMGPYGLGFAYYGERFDHGVPLEDNWIARSRSRDFSRLVDYDSRYAPGMVRYDVGERSNPILLPMLIAALEELLERGVAAIQAYCSSLARGYRREIRELGCEVTDDSACAAHLFGVRLPGGVSWERLQRALTRRRVSVSVRGDAIRVSLNVFNEADDLTALLAALREVVS